MATLFVDGKPFEVDGERNVLESCLSLGFDLPYFCWHPELGSVGACRQCAVTQYKDSEDKKGQIAMACMTPAADGTRVSINDQKAVSFRRSVIEWLMTNHPHDCPVCEEGGECHLQDVTVMTGHAYRRYGYAKRTFLNQDLGPFLGHEMNRCITCYRCIRFYRDYAGGTDLDAFGVHNHVYFGRTQDGPLENEFSGNLTEICPTGVFTDKTLSQRYSRKWDMAATPSICSRCGVGCNMTVNVRHGEFRRILNRYHSELNRYFLCDRGRYGYGTANTTEVPGRPLLRSTPTGDREPGTARAALELLSQTVASRRLLGIGSPRASIEANFALRTLVGPENFHAGLSDDEKRILSSIVEILDTGPAPAATLRNLEQADAALVLGEDLTDTAPRMALALRQSVRERGFCIAAEREIPSWLDDAVRQAAGTNLSPLFVATPDSTGLDDVAALRLRMEPREIARLGFAVAHEIDPEAPLPEGCKETVLERARTIASELKTAERPVVVAGTSLRDEAIVNATANIARALHRRRQKAKLAFVVPEANSLGLALMDGKPLSDALDRLSEGQADGAIILENDLFRRAPRIRLEDAFRGDRYIVVLDTVSTAISRRADILIPVGDLLESEGTLVNGEGRAQRYYRAMNDGSGRRESWRWIAALGRRIGRSEFVTWRAIDDVIDRCAGQIPALAGIRKAAPDSNFRKSGMRLAREPHRFSGRTALDADKGVQEPKPPVDSNSPFSFSMEGFHGTDVPGALLNFYWAPYWNSVQSLNKFQAELGGPLRGAVSGERLFDPTADATAPVYFDPPAAHSRRKGRFRLVPHHHIFSSEELSVRAPAIAARARDPFVALNPDDAGELGLRSGTEIEIALEGQECCLRRRLVLHPQLTRGCAALLVGWSGDRWLKLPSDAILRQPGKS